MLNFLIAVLFVESFYTQITNPPLPTQWHAKVILTEGTLSFTQLEQLDVTATGDFYYDANLSVTVFLLTNSLTGRVTREICVPGSAGRACFVIDASANTCQVAVSGLGKQTFFEPNFLADQNFSLLRVEYLNIPNPNVFYQTQHYQYVSPTNPLNRIDYWYQTETGTPFRFSFGAINPDIVQFTNVIATLDDVPNAAYLFSLPSICNSLRVKPANKKLEAARNQVRLQQAKALKTRASFPAPLSHKWPVAFHCKSQYTGNNFGLTARPQSADNKKDLRELGEPTYVGVNLVGHYYYDYNGHRECNIWNDFHSNIVTRTMITNGKFYYIQTSTGVCTIVPFTPKGPLLPTWPTTLDYVDQQYVLKTERAFIVSNMYGKDALNIGQEHNYTYWEDQITFTPLQFQGPVLEFYPYGQSMSTWGETELGLDGLNLTAIFGIPDNCAVLQPHKLTNEAYMHYSFYKMRHALSV